MGDPIDAERANAAGLVKRLVAPGQARSGAIALARRVTRNAPLSIQSCLRSLNELAGRSDFKEGSLVCGKAAPDQSENRGR
jgi:enoyl-CoA hydratase/carnithine racemase